MSVNICCGFQLSNKKIWPDPQHVTLPLSKKQKLLMIKYFYAENQSVTRVRCRILKECISDMHVCLRLISDDTTIK